MEEKVKKRKQFDEMMAITPVQSQFYPIITHSVSVMNLINRG
jgi:hypothetical protein